jgi:hypothetical protein
MIAMDLSFIRVIKKRRRKILPSGTFQFFGIEEW